ncbi:MAG: ABC transporter ATP-binding protein [Bacillota bacterium]
MSPLSIECTDLGRVFRSRKRRQTEEKTALTDVQLGVEAGELFGLLGPNGAGKSTLIKILATLLLPSSGQAKVLGLDVVGQAGSIRPKINMVSGGEHSGYGILTVRESLWMFSQFYGLSSRESLRRIDELLAIVGLDKDAHTKISKLSTGMRQKMNFCRGFINDPQVLYMDEPTLGLDVGVAKVIRAYMREWMEQRPDRTLLLTTHYMAEADELCDRVAIIDQGRILACDSPTALKRRVGQDSTLQIEVAGGNGFSCLAGMRGVKRSAVTHRPADGRTDLSIILEHDSAVPMVLAALSEEGAGIVSFKKTEPTLEDVFLQLVGRKLTADADAAEQS